MRAILDMRSPWLVQNKLSEFGYFGGRKDGEDGPITKSAVRNFLSRSEVLEDLGLTKTSTISEICSAIKSISQAKYSKMNSDKIISEIIAESKAASVERDKAYKPYSEIAYENQLKAEKDVWRKTVRSNTPTSYYDFLTGEHHKYQRDDRTRLEKTDFYLKARQDAMSKIGLKFDPNVENGLSKFLNTDKQYGINYTVDIGVGSDDGYLFHDGDELHGQSVCLNMSLLKQCYADGVCTEKDHKLHIYGYTTTCVDLEVVYGIGIITLDRDNRDGLCARFETFINQKTGHAAEHAITTEDGKRRCYLHYSKEELNRLMTK